MIKKRLIIFTRYPVAGRTKTRMIPALGEQGAADLHREMAEYTLLNLLALGDEKSTEIGIYYSGGNLSLMQGWKIKISNSLGVEVYPATLISQQQQVLDMSTWGGNGLYLLHLINPQGHITEVKKIVLAP